MHVLKSAHILQILTQILVKTIVLLLRIQHTYFRYLYIIFIITFFVTTNNHMDYDNNKNCIIYNCPLPAVPPAENLLSHRSIECLIEINIT